MSVNPFHPRLSDLPEVLPLFPLPGVILLPRAQLPLQVFEPRYLAMTSDALGAGRLMGIIQPDPARSGGALYGVGCAGRVTAFSETDDGRMLIVLTGICRFAAGEELEPQRGYRRVAPNWAPYAADLEAPAAQALRSRPLLDRLQRYARAKGLEPDVNGLGALSPESLVSALAMNLPFAPAEKQALVEVPTPVDRADLLGVLLDLGAAPDDAGGGVMH